MAPLPVDQVEWMWAGSSGADGITVTARSLRIA